MHISEKEHANQTVLHNLLQAHTKMSNQDTPDIPALLCLSKFIDKLVYKKKNVIFIPDEEDTQHPPNSS